MAATGLLKCVKSLVGISCSRPLSSLRYPLKLDYVSADHTALYNESIKNPEQFWGDLAKQRLRWLKPFDRVMNCDMETAKIRWFEGGQLNVSGIIIYNQ